MANIEDGATGTVLTAPSPQSSGTTLTLNSGETLRFPAPPFYAIAHPNSQIPVRSISEKILVTAVNTGTDVITFQRAVSPYTAKNIDVGWRISNAIFKDDFNNASIINNEVPTGSVNGVNTTFTLASSVHTAGSLRVYRNGVRMKGSGEDYTETTTGFTTTSAPATGTVLLVDYIVTGAINNVGTNSLITDETPVGTVNGSTTAFSALRPYIAGSLEVHINGVKQKRGTHFTETTPSTGAFTMGDAPFTGDDIMINYAFNLNPSSNSDTVDGMHAEDLAPVGAIFDYPASTLPSANFMWAAGQAISRTTYAVLFARYGTTHGIGDGSTTFNLPDRRGRYSVGADNMNGTAANIIQKQPTISTTSGNPSATISSATGIVKGMTIISANVPAGTTITAIVGTTITMSGNASGTASGTAARFSMLADAQAVGSKGGEAAHIQDVNELVSHTHKMYPAGSDGNIVGGGAGGGAANLNQSASAFRVYSNVDGGSTGGGQAFNELPPSDVTNFIVKVA